jgi:hypothetical protein
MAIEEVSKVFAPVRKPTPLMLLPSWLKVLVKTVVQPARWLSDSVSFTRRQVCPTNLGIKISCY